MRTGTGYICGPEYLDFNITRTFDKFLYRSIFEAFFMIFRIILSFNLTVRNIQIMNYMNSL
jgi:hypothetical protein